MGVPKFKTYDDPILDRQVEELCHGIAAIEAKDTTWQRVGNDQILSIIKSYTGAPKPRDGIIFAMSQDYTYDYDGPVSGTVSGITTTDYAVQVYSVTDGEYLQEVAAINPDGTWSVTRARAGIKLARLVRSSDSSVDAEDYTSPGIVRSYTNIPVDDLAYIYLRYRCYTYDQAVATVALCTLGQMTDAEFLINGFIQIYTQNGNKIPAWVHHMSGLCDDPTYIRTGGLAWALYALCFFADKYPTSTLITTVNGMIDTLAAQLLTYQVVDAGYQQGALRGGTGRYVNDIYDPLYTVGWCSTEHNLDAWFALTLAGKVRSNATYTAAAATLKTALLTNFWEPSLNRFVQGISNQTTRDTADALDCHSWGGIWLQAVQEGIKAKQAVSGCATFATIDKGTQGYRPYTPEGGYPNAGTGVWAEGTLGVSLARRATGDPSGAMTDFNPMASRLDADGLPYSTTRDYLYELSDWHSVCAISWLQIAQSPAGFWGVIGDAIEAPAGVIMTTPDGLSRYRIYIDNSGVLTSSLMG